MKKPGQCRLWRLSFSAAEKKLPDGADGKHAPGHKTCRKDVLCLLKPDLFDFYKTRKEPRVFCCYFLNIIMLNLCERLAHDKEWARDERLVRYTDALRHWKTIIAGWQLPYHCSRKYFAGNNIEISKAAAQLRALEKWVSTCLVKYGLYLCKTSGDALHNKEC